MKVRIYTTEDYLWCKRTKEFFEINSIKYKEIDVGKDEKAAKEIVKKSGRISVPIIDVEGKIIVGFDETKLRNISRL